MNCLIRNNFKILNTKTNRILYLKMLKSWTYKNLENQRTNCYDWSSNASCQSAAREEGDLLCAKTFVNPKLDLCSAELTLTPSLHSFLVQLQQTDDIKRSELYGVLSSNGHPQKRAFALASRAEDVLGNRKLQISARCSDQVYVFGKQSLLCQEFDCGIMLHQGSLNIR